MLSWLAHTLGKFCITIEAEAQATAARGNTHNKPTPTCTMHASSLRRWAAEQSLTSQDHHRDELPTTV